ncbi:MAG: leucine-rich repeat domain-containing protein, partial [Candidatus Helarchaeota archaeon]
MVKNQHMLGSNNSQLQGSLNLKITEEIYDRNRFFGLNLDNKNLKKIPDNLDSFKKMTFLSLEGNKIKKITGLEKLKELKILNLSRNGIQKIEGLE